MPTINPYLHFTGNTEEVFNFYKNVFGGEFIMLKRFSELPSGYKFPAEYKDKILHISLSIGKDDILMASDAIESIGQKLIRCDSFSISLSADSKEEADKLFAALSAGGKITKPMEDAFWGNYFGMLTNKFGIQWMVSYNQMEHKKI